MKAGSLWKCYLKFKRLASLSEDPEVIAAAIEKSENKLVELSRGSQEGEAESENPLPELNDERRKELTGRTAYAKGFPLDEEMDAILSFLEPYGPFESCSRRGTPDHKFKGSCFIVFKDVETCKKFVEAEDVKYKDVELIRKFQQDYWDDKKKEMDERKKAKKEKKGKIEEKPEKNWSFPKAVVHFQGIEEGENNAVEFVKKLTDGELIADKLKLKFRVLEGEEQEKYLQKSSEAIIEMRKKMSGKFKQKRKGNFGNQGGGHAKYKKRNH
ncbi:hypothetical protein JTB14_026689 [Gonioctena quinquepunctata]|nr:hypothetical protein JTB14_026689 [Gonioctena quinquepunctata]